VSIYKLCRKGLKVIQALTLSFLPASDLKRIYNDDKPGFFHLSSGPTIGKPNKPKIQHFAGHSTFDIGAK